MTGNAFPPGVMVSARPLVHVALRGLEALAGDCLHGVGGASDDRLRVVVRFEVRENVVGEWAGVAAFGPAHANPQAKEVLGPELLRDRPEPVVACKPATRARLEAAEVEVSLVVHDE